MTPLRNLNFFQLTEPPIAATSATLPPRLTTETSSPNATTETQLQRIHYLEIVPSSVAGLVIIVAIMVVAIIVLVAVIQRKKRKSFRNSNSTHRTDDVQHYPTTLMHSVDFNIKENIAYDACKFEQSHTYEEVQPNSSIHKEVYESIVYENSLC